MHPNDEEKIVFMIDGPSYYYKVMPFELKNVGATCQRLMDKAFTDQISRNMEVYADDMVAKTPTMGDYYRDLEEIFAQLRKRSMGLNPDKCAFGVKAGKFLGFMITRRGIEANPK